MTAKKLAREIQGKIRDEVSNIEYYEDMFELIKIIDKDDRKKSIKISQWLKKRLLIAIRRNKKDNAQYYEVYRKCLLYESPYIFDSYLQYMEIDREPEKRFYLPRRNVLKVVVDDLQDLEDGVIKYLNISLPPRVGKSTLGCFFISWLMGKYPSMANVMSGHSDKLTDGFYREVLSIINDSQYHWSDIFPKCKVVNTNSKNETIDINKTKRFSTLTCRSIGGTLTGAVEVGKCLYCDDLIEDLEEALNPDRLQAKYDAYANQLKDRMKKKAYQLMIGTRWAVNDVQGKIEQQYCDDDRYRFRTIPALDENNESNFDYPYDLGFDTAYYMDMKNSIDDATWSAKYMGKPYDRDGVLFNADELNYYNGKLPTAEADSILCACDVAWGGTDYLSMPIAYIYGNNVYIQDVVYNNGDKDVTKPMVVGKIISNNVQVAQFEANAGGDEYSDSVDEKLRENGYCCNVSHRRTTVSDKGKGTRILQYSPEIKKFYFIDDKHRSTEYRKFMYSICSYTVTGKNKNDDAIDSLAMLARMIVGNTNKCEVFRRPF